MKDKSCNTCRHNVGLHCRVLSGGPCGEKYENWKPREGKEVSGKIPVTEEGWLIWINDNIMMDIYADGLVKFNKEETLKCLHRHGYIKKTDLEIAAGNYHSMTKGNIICSKDELLCLADCYIDELEKERLKSGKN